MLCVHQVQRNSSQEITVVLLSSHFELEMVLLDLTSTLVPGPVLPGSTQLSPT